MLPLLLTRYRSLRLNDKHRRQETAKGMGTSLHTTLGGGYTQYLLIKGFRYVQRAETL